MARSGVLYEEVKQAAEAMLAEKVNPTHARIRERLGGGSFSTIGRHLQAWREARDAAPSAPPPEGLRDILQQVWQELDAAASARITEAQQEARDTVAEAADAAAQQIAAIEAGAQQDLENARGQFNQARDAAQAQAAQAVAGWQAAEARADTAYVAQQQMQEQLLELGAEAAKTRAQLDACERALAAERARADAGVEALSTLQAQHRQTLEMAQAQHEEARVQTTHLQTKLDGAQHSLRAAQAEHAQVLVREREALAVAMQRATAAETQAAAAEREVHSLRTTHATAMQTVAALTQQKTSSEETQEILRAHLATVQATGEAQLTTQAQAIESLTQRLVTTLQNEVRALRSGGTQRTP